MRTSVAILEGRPETIVQDYGRLLKLVGFNEFCQGASPVLVPAIREDRWFPGLGTPPWQLDGVLQECSGVDGSASYMVISPGNKAGQDVARAWGWDSVLRNCGISAVPASTCDPVSFRPQGHFPALEAVLPQGLALAPALWDRPVVMLPVSGLSRRKPLFGCVDLLERLMGLSLPQKSQKVPMSEVLAELLGYIGESLPKSLYVMDAVIWAVPSGLGGIKPVMRHVILAGEDPLAVDATAMRLLGFEPMTLPWVALASQRGAGYAKKADITILGQPELLDLDFQKRKSTLSSLPDWENPFWMRDEKRWARWLWQLRGRAAEIKKFRNTSWGSLFEAYQSGKQTGAL